MSEETRLPKPDARLRAVMRAVRPGAVAADIGADHAYLICHLVFCGKTPRGYACDIGEGPLARAEKTVREAGLSGRVALRLTDGLRGLPLEEIDDIVIAGMGGETIAHILAECPSCQSPEKRFILQPMTKAEELRRALYRGGFQLEREEAVVDGRRLYTVMTAAYTGERRESSSLFAWCGLHMPPACSQSAAYLRKITRSLEKRAAGLLRAGYAGEAEQYATLVREIAAALNVWDRQP